VLAILTHIARSLPWKPEEHGPLPMFLLVWTFITGLVDALSYLNLGRVFVANMTGNVVFLGFAVAGAQDFSISASLVAIGAFLVGALASGRLGTSVGSHRGRYLAATIYCKIVLIGTALALVLIGAGGVVTLIALLAMSMGLQNAAARRLGVPDLTTTVLTLTLTGLAADSTWAGGRSAQPTRKLLAAATMFAGAAVGALLALRAGSSAVLELVLFLQIVSGIAAYFCSSSTAAWTAQR
jgi:uncharacterized membrane protein YoaK (UPF0700 family)